MISVNAPGLVYKVGLINPTALFLITILYSLISVIILPNTGAEAEVP